MSTSTKVLPDDTMIAQMAQIFQIMGDESRLKILRSLMGGALTVNEIVGLEGLRGDRSCAFYLSWCVKYKDT